MSDFGTMQERIRREIKRDGLTADIKAAIDSSIRFYNEDRFFFNEQSGSANTVTDQPTVTLPSGLIEIDNVKVYQSDATGAPQTPLVQRTIVDIDNRDDGNEKGEPQEYALYNELMRVLPVPDKVYPLKFLFKEELNDVSASASDAATNAWMTDGEVLIRSRAKHYVFLHNLRNMEEAAKMKGAARDEWESLKTASKGRLSTGKLVRTRF